MTNIISILLLSFSLLNSGVNKKTIIEQNELHNNPIKHIANQEQSIAVFASGCFWCVEAVFESVNGVSEAVSGYTGGKKRNANYEAVSAGITDHAESVQIFYNPNIISYETLLEVFFGSQDPTTLNQQGNDKGRQYRSTIFYANEIEKKSAENYIIKLTSEKVFDSKITTTLEKLTTFYPAEDYHQNYEKLHPNQSYVKNVSVPRLNRFKKKFPHLLKSNQ
ncbi:MAG: peptide-methionine (S)-S-oxide reductase MsrA [Saprospiraceae bacterium]